MIETILNALNQPFAIGILLILARKKEAKLTDILVELNGITKYKRIRNTIEEMIKANLIERRIEIVGAAKKWILRLTSLGQTLVSYLDQAIKNAIKK